MRYFWVLGLAGLLAGCHPAATDSQLIEHAFNRLAMENPTRVEVDDIGVTTLTNGNRGVCGTALIGQNLTAVYFVYDEISTEFQQRTWRDLGTPAPVPELCGDFWEGRDPFA